MAPAVVISALAAAPSNAATSPAGVDQQAGTNRLISKTYDGSPANGSASGGSVSADGRYVAFTSSATNLVRGVDGETPQVYVRDRKTGTTILASVSSSGEPSNEGSSAGVISADGRYVAFASDSTNLSDSAASTHRPDGFGEDIKIYRVDLATMTTTTVTNSTGRGHERDCYEPSISGDGQLVTYQTLSSDIVRHDRNRDYDIFLYDYATGKTVTVSHNVDGETADGFSANAHISAGGSTVLFDTDATDIVAGGHRGNRDVVAYDVATGTNRLVTNGNNESYAHGLSADGTRGVFNSLATDLVDGVPDDSDLKHVYLADLATGDLLLVDHSVAGEPGDGDSYAGAVSDDGLLVAFGSTAMNLVPQDHDPGSDVFLLDVAAGTTTLISHRYSGDGPANGDSFPPSLSGDGSYVTYYSTATDLVPGDTDPTPSTIGYRIS